jgi:hypothetical protein
MNITQTIKTFAVTLAVLLTIAGTADATDFGEIGVGTQMLIVDGDDGSESGFGIDVRTRFLWLLGVDFTASDIDSSEALWGVNPYRVNLMLHAISAENFDLYFSPGMSGGSLSDALNPTGATTWYRLGGGAEVRFLDGLAIGFEAHWTVPGEQQMEEYVNDYGEQLLAEYVAAMGETFAIPSGYEDLSTSDLLGVLPLDRVEFAIGMRYYF